MKSSDSSKPSWLGIVASKKSRARRARIMAVVWSVFGVVGLVQYGYHIATTPGAWEKMLSTPIAASIPILFVISIAANVHGALAEASGDE